MNNQKMKSIEFVRFGGLSPVNHKELYKLDTFHSPPVKKGIYAFIFPYIEDFLWRWKTTNHKKYHINNRKQFKYTGDIWCHFKSQARSLGVGIEYKKEWVKIHTSDLPIVLNKTKHHDRKDLRCRYDITHPIRDPYKRGCGGFVSREHLEVFIERV